MTYSWLTKLLWALFGLEICLSPVNLLYYYQELTTNAIAQKLGLSRPKVSRLRLKGVNSLIDILLSK